MKMCRTCGLPIQEFGKTDYRKWCDSMHRLLILKTVQPEQCHRNCFMTAITTESASPIDGSIFYSEKRCSTGDKLPARRNYVKPSTAIFASSPVG
jgi:hypothetical protein